MWKWNDLKQVKNEVKHSFIYHFLYKYVNNVNYIHTLYMYMEYVHLKVPWQIAVLMGDNDLPVFLSPKDIPHGPDSIVGSYDWDHNPVVLKNFSWLKKYICVNVHTLYTQIVFQEW